MIEFLEQRIEALPKYCADRYGDMQVDQQYVGYVKVSELLEALGIK